MNSDNSPWQRHMDDIPMHLQYFDGSMFDALEAAARKYPDHIALDFMGKSTTYKALIRQIRVCAGGLKALGLREGDTLTVAMPNCPQAVCLFYAANLAGGIANMIHPLSAEKEIAFYLNEAGSAIAITLDQFCHKFQAIRSSTKLSTLIVTGIRDALPLPMKACCLPARSKAREQLPPAASAIPWKSFIRLGKHCACDYAIRRGSNDPGVILYSGGTTGTTKGIVLTNRNFNALGQQVIAANPMFRPGDKMLAAMPIFHGFGLGVCIHSMLMNGGRCVLVPRFTPRRYGRELVKHRCSFIAGVPTLFEALLRLPGMDRKNLSFLKGVFSGGDTLSPELKRKLDQFLVEHRAAVQVREGYGTTETVTACCLTPPHIHREGSVGLPFPDTFIKIVEPGTANELPCGQEGEILISGPTVMREYLHHPEETAQVLRTHPDGRSWVYTGDLGTVDPDGFVYFRGRAKRMIVTSGYNVYPAQLESILDAHEAVQMSCVIGVPDPYKIRKIKAFVILTPGTPANEETKAALCEHCRRHIARYAMPCDIEFRSEFPKTRVGKVAYRVLEEEEQKKQEESQNETNH